MVLTARFSHRACEDNYSHNTRSAHISEDPEAVGSIVSHAPKQVQRRLDPDQTLQLIAAYLQGQSVSQLARDWKIHRTTIMEHLQRHDVPTRPHKRKMTDQQVIEAAKRYRAGDSLATIGNHYGVDAKTMSRELKAARTTHEPDVSNLGSHVVRLARRSERVNPSS